MQRYPEYPFIGQDGRKFWSIDRCAMMQREHVVDRMAEDIVILAGIVGEDATVDDNDLVRFGWSRAHLRIWGHEARDEAHRRLRPLPLRELAIACSLFAVLVGGIWLAGAASLIERAV